MPFIKKRKASYRRSTVVKYVPRPMRTELKHYDSSSTIPLGTGWGTVPLLCATVQGTDFTQRIGRRVHVTHYELKCTLQPTVANVSVAGDTVRCVIFKDTQANGATIATANVFETNVIASFMNASTLARVKVHHDTMINILPSSTAAGVTTGTENIRAMHMPNIRGHVINYGANTATIGDVADNVVYCGCAASSPTIGNLVVFWRVWFRDV